MPKPGSRKKLCGSIGEHFLDSGSFSMRAKAIKFGKENSCPSEAFYDSDEFHAYFNTYMGFIKKYREGIDYYANMDVIGSPEKTLIHQLVMETEGLSPVPVVHFKTDLKWLGMYLNRNRHEVIGLGGLVGNLRNDEARDWLDAAFSMFCPNSNGGKPIVKVHGFGVTLYSLIIKYPWWSVDSVFWTKMGGFGMIFLPHKRKGKWDYSVEPYLLSVGDDCPKSKLEMKRKHLSTMSEGERSIVYEWLDHIEIPVGDNVTKGVVNSHSHRRAANLCFFEKMRKSLPEWPWAWKPHKKKRNLGLL